MKTLEYRLAILRFKNGSEHAYFVSKVAEELDRQVADKARERVAWRKPEGRAR